MTEATKSRERAYLDLLHRGLVMVRNFAHGGNVDLCRVEADHLHNIPTLIDESNELRHLYYIQQERGLYLQRLRELGATEYLKSVSAWYSEPWSILASAAGVTLEEEVQDAEKVTAADRPRE